MRWDQVGNGKVIDDGCNADAEAIGRNRLSRPIHFRFKTMESEEEEEGRKEEEERGNNSDRKCGLTEAIPESIGRRPYQSSDAD